jgi:mannosyltransferase OCH1-like enzyme
MNNEIPRIIHYCWFGKKAKPKLVRDCIASWKLYFDGYEIIEWNEANYDSEHPFFRSAMDRKMWAFASDFARLDVLQKFGGIYLDTDLLVIKPFTDLLINKVNIGAESTEYVNGAFIATCKNHLFITDCLSYYDNLKIFSADEKHLMKITIPIIMTRTLTEKYLQAKSFERFVVENEVTIFPNEYFYPLPYSDRQDINNYFKYLGQNSVAVHLWNASWKKYNSTYFFEQKRYIEGYYTRCFEITNKGLKKIKLFFKKIIYSLSK